MSHGLPSFSLDVLSYENRQRYSMEVKKTIKKSAHLQLQSHPFFLADNPFASKVNIWCGTSFCCWVQMLAGLVLWSWICKTTRNRAKMQGGNKRERCVLTSDGFLLGFSQARDDYSLLWTAPQSTGWLLMQWACLIRQILLALEAGERVVGLGPGQGAFWRFINATSKGIISFDERINFLLKHKSWRELKCSLLWLDPPCTRDLTSASFLAVKE